MQEYTTLAAIDLGSNSFRLQVVRVVDGQLYELDSIKETVRLAAGINSHKIITEEAQKTALACLKRFNERLRGFPTEAVRAVGTNSLRVAKNASSFLARAEEVLGFPIEVIAGREEARLVYLGVAHGLPVSGKRRLVVDIGGGSTECIIGEDLDTIFTESLYMGCVSYSLRYFPHGKITSKRMQEAELAARAELQTITHKFAAAAWTEALASSGTARAIGEIIEKNGFGESVITQEGMTKLRAALIKAGDWRDLSLSGLSPERAPVIAGGFAILAAVMHELKIERMGLSDYALRHGILFDMIGRARHQDMREVTLRQFMHRYQVDPAQAKRVEHSALSIFQATAAALPEAQRKHAMQMLVWAAQLHEIGISISYSGYHKHSAYIVQHADMPGFSKTDQSYLSLLLLLHCGSLNKLQSLMNPAVNLTLILSLRLAVLFNRGRTEGEVPVVEFVNKRDHYQLSIDKNWLEHHPLTQVLLTNEITQWRAAGLTFRVRHT